MSLCSLRSPLVAAAATGASLLLLASPAQAAPCVVISRGHVDVIDIEFEDGALEVGVHDESVEPAVERDPDDVRFRVTGAARTQVPPDPAYSWLGQPGSTVWILPEVQDPAVIWPGISTEELDAGVFVEDEVVLRLKKVSGPGDFSVFTTNAFGAPQRLLDSGDGLPDRLELPVGTHQHYNWAFEKAGNYRLTFEVRARVAGTGELISSGNVVYRFEVRN